MSEDFTLAVEPLYCKCGKCAEALDSAVRAAFNHWDGSHPVAHSGSTLIRKSIVGCLRGHASHEPMEMTFSIADELKKQGTALCEPVKFIWIDEGGEVQTMFIRPDFDIADEA
jgi:hypothetical protein